MERIVIAMQDGGAGAGARHAAVRAARPPHFVLPPNLYMRTPGRGDFSVSNFHPDPIPGNLDENNFGVRGVAGAVSGVACFGLPPWKNFRQRDRDHLVPPRSWMQQSAVPRCAILRGKHGSH